ncbi:MAG: PQQ-dependent sugar dehydrogenase [Pseudomonadota bacterium]
MRNDFVALLALTSITFGAAQTSADTPGFGLADPVPSSAYSVETIVQGLDTPWDIAWLPNGDMLITERGGTLRLVRNGQLLEAPIDGVPSVFVKSQAGLFEVLPHPEFSENGWLYLSYAHGTDKQNTLRLARARYVETADGAQLQDLEVLFEADAYRRTAQHYGGRFVFLPDQTLLLTSGDGYAYRHDAQKLDSHFGKILRLTDTGEAPADNPFVNTPGALPEIWSYGHRNHQGIALSADGTVYSNEHGARGGDEINVIEAGQNYGWPFASWGVDYSGAQITPFKEVDETVQPIFYWTPSIAPGALLSYDGDAFPDWQGYLLSTGLATREVRLADPAAPAAKQASLLAERDVRVRDVTMGPDGFIYVSTEGTDGDEILKLSPAP